MSPTTITKLLENVPEFLELRKFLASEADKLNRLDNLDEKLYDTPEKIALEVKSRKNAYTIITGMLAPLLNIQEMTGGVDPKEYIV